MRFVCQIMIQSEICISMFSVSLSRNTSQSVKEPLGSARNLCPSCFESSFNIIHIILIFLRLPLIWVSAAPLPEVDVHEIICILRDDLPIILFGLRIFPNEDKWIIKIMIIFWLVEILVRNLVEIFDENGVKECTKVCYDWSIQFYEKNSWERFFRR